MDKCPCRSCKPGDIRDRGLYSTLPIPHCANSVLYVDYTETPKFGGYDLALVVTCGLTRFTRVFPCTKHITREETIKILLEEWFCVYGAPKEINSDEDVRVRSDTEAVWGASPIPAAQPVALFARLAHFWAGADVRRLRDAAPDRSFISRFLKILINFIIDLSFLEI